MRSLNMFAAKTQLSRLVDRAIAGEEVIIARAGKPMVRLVPVGAGAPRTGFGALRGRIRIAGDFHAALPDRARRAFGWTGESAARHPGGRHVRHGIRGLRRRPAGRPHSRSRAGCPREYLREASFTGDQDAIVRAVQTVLLRQLPFKDANRRVERSREMESAWGA